MGFKSAISDWAEDNPLGAKIMAQQAEIALLQAEVDRLTEELTASCARAEMQQREAERLRRNSSVLHDTIEKIFAEGAKQLARADTAWNDAIEAAAAFMENHAYTTTGGERSMEPTKFGEMDMHHTTAASAIRALKRT